MPYKKSHSQSSREWRVCRASVQSWVCWLENGRGHCLSPRVWRLKKLKKLELQSPGTGDSKCSSSRRARALPVVCSSCASRLYPPQWFNLVHPHCWGRASFTWPTDKYQCEFLPETLFQMLPEIIFYSGHLPTQSGKHVKLTIIPCERM